MPGYYVGDVWSAFDDVDFLFFTANSVVSPEGLVMGAGMARQVRDRFPIIPVVFGRRVIEIAPQDYNVLVFGKIGAFQTKRHYAQPSTLELIASSVAALNNFISFFAIPPKIALNYPGIGLGGLSKHKVFPIIQRLPSNVQIWEQA
jgi:hypothetical protein